MKTSEVQILLQKYFDAETSLEEEKLLTAYFKQDDLPEEILPFKKWFTGIGEITFSSNVDSFNERVLDKIEVQENNRKLRIRQFRLTLAGIAASLIFVVGSLIYYFQQPAYQDTFSDPAAAIAYAEKTMSFVSSEYNKGLAQLAPVQRLNQSTLIAGKSVKILRKGLDKVNKLHLINNFNEKK